MELQSSSDSRHKDRGEGGVYVYGTYSDLGPKDRGEGGVYDYGTYSDSGHE